MADRGNLVEKSALAEDISDIAKVQSQLCRQIVQMEARYDQAFKENAKVHSALEEITDKLADECGAMYARLERLTKKDGAPWWAQREFVKTSTIWEDVRKLKESVSAAKENRPDIFVRGPIPEDHPDSGVISRPEAEKPRERNPQQSEAVYYHQVFGIWHVNGRPATEIEVGFINKIRDLEEKLGKHL